MIKHAWDRQWVYEGSIGLPFEIEPHVLINDETKIGCVRGCIRWIFGPSVWQDSMGNFVNS